MSDLDQAVQAEIDAYRPASVPSFDALAGRKRARDRRRLATAGATLSAFAIAAVAALAPSLGNGRDELPPAVAPAAEQTASFTVLYRDLGLVDPRTPERLDTCLALPGVEHSQDSNRPQAHEVTVTGTAEARAFAACLRPITDVELQERGTDPARDLDSAALVRRCLTGFSATAVPGLVGKTEQEAFPPNARSAVRVLARDGDCTDERLAGDGITHVVLEDGTVVWAGRVDDPQDGPVPRAGDTRAYLAQMDDCAERKGVTVTRNPGGGSVWGVPPGQAAVLRTVRAECQRELGVSSVSPPAAPPGG